MAIANIIKQNRNKLGLTQEEMAKRLGVTAPAVNKWEKGNTLPDVSLLAPIARLLGITTDELLSFREELTEEEVNQFLLQVQTDLRNKPFSVVFAGVQKKIEEYPNCEKLIWQAAMILYAYEAEKEIPDQKNAYELIICRWFERCLCSEDIHIRKSAAEALFYKFYQEDDFDKANTYLEYYSGDDPERLRKEALIYRKTGKQDEAFKTYEGLIFDGYQSLQKNLNSLRVLYMEDDNHEMPKKLAQISSLIAKAFEMGKYHEISSNLDVAAWEKDVDWTIDVFRSMLDSVDTIGDFLKSSLYQHMRLKSASGELSKQVRLHLMELVNSEEFEYMNGNEIWNSMKAGNRS